jgi:hypothetical protein
MHCELCFTNFAIVEEKIFYDGKFFHRKCLVSLKKLPIKDEDLRPIFYKGAYNVYEISSPKKPVKD